MSALGPDPTLNEVLRALGIAKRPAAVAGRYEYLRGGVVVHTGTAWTAWEWLRETGLHAPEASQ